MMQIAPFPFRRLTDEAELEYALDATGALVLRGGAHRSRPPLTTARVRGIDGVTRERLLTALPFAWHRAALHDDGWVLRTRGAPITMERVRALWGSSVRDASHALGLDERLALVTIGCEAGAVAPDDEGLVKAPRTAPGYPRRRSEADPGDFARDAEDWHLHRESPRDGTHSLHGLMQMVLYAAVAARRELFDGIAPSRYRTVLWDPASAVACGLAHIASFEESARRDPLRMRFQYASGRIVKTREIAWGASGIYDDLVALFFVALWNDDAALRLELTARVGAWAVRGGRVAGARVQAEAR